MVAESPAEEWPLPGAPRLNATIGLVALEQKLVIDDSHWGRGEVQMTLRIKQIATHDALVEHLPVTAVAVGAARRVWVGAQIGYVVELGVRGRGAKGRGVVSEGLCPEMAAQYAAVRGIVHVADNDDVCTWIGCEQAVGVRT